MNEYRVTFTSMVEQYEYYVNADSPDAAEQEGLAMAEFDGLWTHRYYHSNVELLS